MFRGPRASRPRVARACSARSALSGRLFLRELVDVLMRQAQEANRAQASEQSGRARQLALAIVSIVMGIPITAISATNVDPNILGVAVSWAGIVGVNWVHARAIRKRK